MFVIGKREGVQLFKSVKSIIIIAILLLTSYYSSKFSHLFVSFADLTEAEARHAHLAGLSVLLLLFGQLFINSLSHDSLNREIHDRTIRFLITRTSSRSILLGKFAGIWMFWMVCFVVSFLITLFYSRQVDLFIFAQIIGLLTYQTAFVILFSAVTPRPSVSMFAGVLIGLFFPLAGMWLTFTTNPWVSWLKWVTPYYYLERNDYSFIMMFALAVVMLAVANYIFKRRLHR